MAKLLKNLQQQLPLLEIKLKIKLPVKSNHFKHEIVRIKLTLLKRIELSKTH